MSENNLKVEIISPDGVLFQGDCQIAVIPSIGGEIGLMAFHEIVMTKLTSGSIKLFDQQQKCFKSFEISSGYAKMQSVNHLLIAIEQPI